MSSCSSSLVISFLMIKRYQILTGAVCLVGAILLVALAMQNRRAGSVQAAGPSQGSPSQGSPSQGSPSQGRLDPASWGRDHVGQPVPEFVSGDECLFCHRQEIGTNWSQNAHATTIRRAESQRETIRSLRRAPDLARFADEAQFVMGRQNRIRFLKRLPAYGQLAILSAGWNPNGADSQEQFSSPSNPHWDGQSFGNKCAGCHATGVDRQTGSFSALSLDCFVCHGDASLDHTNDSSLVHLASKRRDSPAVITSICAQCHIRVGKSRSTGRPYADNFVAGDNLFRDLQVDFSDQALAELNPVDRHVLENVRDVVVHGRQNVTCLSCHAVHRQSTEKHYDVARGKICLNCHYADRPESVLKELAVHSRVCEY